MNVKVSEVHESKKLNIIKIAVCFRFIYRFNTIPFIIPDDRESYFTSYTKINSKRIKDLNLRAKFSRKQRGDFFNLGFGKGFFFF